MKNACYLPFAVLVFLPLCTCAAPKADYPITPIHFTDVELTDVFWAPRLEIVHKSTIPACFKQCEESGRIKNFEIAAGLAEGKFQTTFPFDDSDVYKVMEGAANIIHLTRDAELDDYMDRLIAVIAAAQERDGYLCTWRTIDPCSPPQPWSGTEGRWSNLASGHELYNVGHMYEAAVAHYLATGKKNFLRIATKNADLICKVFGPKGVHAVPGHEEIEIGLVKLYRVTGKKKYLDMAEFFLDQRGNTESRAGLYGLDLQDHKPIFEQKEAVGHAVRAMYLYTAMADVAALKARKEYIDAIGTLWEDVVYRKMYITGGVGCREQGEAFGDAYELPNRTAYTETCASIGQVFFNQRMFLLHGDAKYIDVLERALYNGVLSGISATGDRFCYRNPLEMDETVYGVKREPWIGCACCPSNLARTISSVGNYFYAQKGRDLYVNLFAKGSGTFEVDGVEIKLHQKTDYPWSGKVEITVEPEKRKTFTVNVRIPGWAQGRPVPGDLYHFADGFKPSVQLAVNGYAVNMPLVNGYAPVKRGWRKGDHITLNFEMDVRRLAANEKVETDRGRIAFQRGPLVYAFESKSHDHKIFDLTVPADAYLTVTPQQGAPLAPLWLTFTKCKANLPSDSFRIIPFYYRANSGPGDLIVWPKTKQN